ncbi:TolC family protein [Motilimonas pumila]|uniref:TolC family protein n=1 Tax=Motilimonas pumila TaxID=2303987 RepID=A0A418YEA0_9GAMM|nr:TolC family protein [Motilimonas pumila]RJG47481.1 TolC family protein [Motilimonas pumila]
MDIVPIVIRPVLGGLVLAATSAAAHTPNYASDAEITAATDTLTALINAALTADPARQKYQAQSLAMQQTGVASATLMDPKMKVGVGGLPVDSFKFDQDPMTNISVGLMQQFERGDTLALRQRQANQQAGAMALQVAVRERELANTLTQLWLELGYQQVAEAILLQNQDLLQQLHRLVRTNYSVGKSEAQDLLNSELQLAKLDEKLQANQQSQRRLQAQFSQWLGSAGLPLHQVDLAANQLRWPNLQPQLQQLANQTEYFNYLKQHPLVQMAQTQIASSQTQVALAEQAYQPQFAVEVMYAHRQADNMMGEPASDLLSAYLTVDLPFSTSRRQDKQLSAAQYQVGAARLQKDDLLLQMNAKLNALLVDRNNLSQRIERYQSRLLPQAQARISAVERGYNNHTAEFNDVISASQDALALALEQQRLLTDINIVNSQLAALLDGFEYQVTAPPVVREQ